MVPHMNIDALRQLIKLLRSFSIRKWVSMVAGGLNLLVLPVKNRRFERIVVPLEWVVACYGLQPFVEPRHDIIILTGW